MFHSTGKIKDNSLLLNNETDSTFLMLRSKLNQSFRVAYRTVSSNMAKISLGFYIWQNVLQENILRIKCKIWETRKIFVILHSALCYNYYVEEVPHIVVLHVGQQVAKTIKLCHSVLSNNRGLRTVLQNCSTLKANALERFHRIH